MKLKIAPEKEDIDLSSCELPSNETPLCRTERHFY